MNGYLIASIVLSWFSVMMFAITIHFTKQYKIIIKNNQLLRQDREHMFKHLKYLTKIIDDNHGSEIDKIFDSLEYQKDREIVRFGLMEKSQTNFNAYDPNSIPENIDITTILFVRQPFRFNGRTIYGWSRKGHIILNMYDMS